MKPSDKKSDQRIHLFIKYGSRLCVVLITSELVALLVYLSIETAELNED